MTVTPQQVKKLERELGEYLESLTTGMGRPERRSAMGLYMTGLLLEGARKSIEPIAARLVDDPSDVEPMRQRLQECVTVSSWNEQELFRRVALKLDAELPEVEALVIDDTGFPKKGKHSVGVARQYSGTLGRTENCQVAVSLHLAGEQGSGCIGMRLYLPDGWTDDRPRCHKAGVPDDIKFKKKWEIALEMVDAAASWGVRKHIVLADAGYGDVTEFREGLAQRGLKYAVAVQSTLVVWPPGVTPSPPLAPQSGDRGRARSRYRDGDAKPVAVGKLAQELGRARYRKVTWREGTRGPQSSRFIALRVRTAHGHTQGKPPGAEQWLLCEWGEHDEEPRSYLSNLAADCSLKQLVRAVKLRWRVERDYQDMKDELGLDHFEGRRWRGFHHHAALCAAAHAFLALRRALFPPQPSEVDAPARAPAPAARAAAQARRLPPVRQRPGPGRAAARPVPNLMGADRDRCVAPSKSPDESVGRQRARSAPCRDIACRDRLGGQA